MSAESQLAAELQAQSRWLRSLARSLVGDGAADDLVQDTYAQALARPPDTDRPLRPWLRRVAVNIARMGWRSGERRRAREERGAGLEDRDGAGADETLARAELQRELAGAVLTLDEPYRQTILLRYVDDLSAAEIARRQDVPAGTVRSRLKRGLDHLRVELDRRHGQRNAWQRALLPLAVPTSATKSTAIASGALIMKITTTSIAAAAIVTLAFVAWPDPEPPRAENLAPAAADTSDARQPARLPTAIPEPQATIKRFHKPGDRQRFAAALAAVRARRQRYRETHSTPAPSTEHRTPPTLAAPALDREYIQDRIHEVVPMLEECYDLALDAQPDAALEGKLHVSFTIDAEEEVGGYVSEAKLADPDSALGRALGECVTETIYSIEFVPPEGGGKVEVNYPFTFSRDESED